MKRFVLVLLLLPTAAAAALQVRQIALHVEPYYESAATRQDRPQVAGLGKYNRRLASTRREDIAAVRDEVRAEPQLVTPVTMMVLAIRLYDVGLRDDAVFWFYAARDRLATVAGVIDSSSPDLSQADQATRTIARLAGPTIGGYAYCDIGRHNRLRREALDWVESHPYQPLFLEQVPAKPGDRRANLERALDELRASVRDEAAYLAVPANAARLVAARREEEADDKYCWK